jgi:hypothetical protein
MYPHQHAGVSIGATYGIAWTAGVDPSLSVVGWTVLGGLLIDVIDHPLYQLTHGRRDRVLAEAWRRARDNGLRAGLTAIREAEDARVFNRLFLHSANGLLGSLVLALAATALVPVPALCAVALGWLVHMVCDVTWDFKSVGHARNWFARRGLPWRPDDGTAQTLARSWHLWWAAILFGVGVVALRLAVELRDAAHLPRISPLGYLTGLFVAAIASLLLAVATALWCHCTILKEATGVAPLLRIPWPDPPSLEWGSRGRLTAARLFRRDHLILSAWIAIALPVVLVTWTVLEPDRFIDVHQVPVMIAAAPLVVMICTGVFGHTTAASVGGLTGVVMSVLTERLLAHANLIDAWAPLAAFGVVVGGLAAWVFSLVLGRWSGRARASSVLFAIVPPAGGNPGSEILTPAIDTVNGEGVADLCAVFERACREALGDRVTVHRATWPWAGADHWGVTPAREVLVFVDQVRIRLRASYSPVLHEDDAAFHRTFCPASVSPTPLMPRAWAGAAAPHAQVRSGQLSWVKGYDRTYQATARPDGVTMHKALSEIVDNLLTRQSDVIVDVCRLRHDDGDAYAVIATEQTSTKIYATPEAEHVGFRVASHLARKTGDRVLAGRIVSSMGSGEHPLGFVGEWSPGIASDGTGRELSRVAALLQRDFQPRPTRLLVQRLLVGVIQLAGLLPVIQWLGSVVQQ